MTDRFQPFGTEHLVMIGLCLVGCVAVGLLGRAVRGSDRGRTLNRAFAIAIPVFTVPLQVSQLLPGDYTRGSSLPLQVCDLAWVLAVYALLTRSPRASQLLYFWGLTLVPQAIATPALLQPFPDLRWFMFWGMHFLTVWAAVYLTFGLGIRPSWSGFRLAVVATLVWAASVMAFNAVAGTNYGYLNRKPDVASLLDVLGPWPAYVVVEIALVTAVWALMTWPWVRSGIDQGLPRRPWVRGAS